MCGICGIWYFDPEHIVDERLLRQMTARLVHRGPDDEGIVCTGSVGLGTRRLKVIDVDGSCQPLANEDATIHLVCNGEIYNFRSLRGELAARHRFHTNGDVEAVLHLYEECGEQCVEPLRGMFAFAMWDSRKDVLMLAVDRFGKKPLYYTFDEEKILFASEMKAILAHPGMSHEIDLEALDQYLACGYISAPRSIFKSVRKLCPGSTMTVDRVGVRLYSYWQPHFCTPDEWDRRSPSDLCAELHHLLIESVGLRLASDVPIGAFLSGGIDSSAVVALMCELGVSPVKTFSIGFEDTAYDESRYAQEVARCLGLENVSTIVHPGHVIDLLPKLVRHFDEPFADSSMIPTYVLSQLARSEVTVILSGDGGDEVFAGYHQHLYGYRQQFLEKHIPLALHSMAASASGLLSRSVKAKPYLAALGRPVQEWHRNGFFSKMQRAELYGGSDLRTNAAEQIRNEVFRRAAGLDGLSQLQLFDLQEYLPGDILVKVDRTSMLSSLEVRCPLLDHVVFEFMACVPPHHRVSLRAGKTLLKGALGSLLPPFVSKRKKQGFSIPQSEWLRDPCQGLLRDLVAQPSTLFDCSYVEGLVEEHISGLVDHKDRLWALLCFELWYQGQSG